MDHAEVRERLESALLSPGKLQSLDADATQAGEELRAHVAGCAACARELLALRETAALLAAAAPDDLEAPPEAREAVLRRIRETGVARRVDRQERVAASTAAGLRGSPVGRVSQSALAGSPLALAAVLAVLLVGTALLGSLAAARDARDREARELVAVTAATDRLLREPDSRKVVLRDMAGNAAGSVVYSPATHQLVVVSDALARPAQGERYECYVAQAGDRRNIGWMHFADGLAYWAGPVESLAATPGSEMEFIVTRAGRDVLRGDL